MIEPSLREKKRYIIIETMNKIDFETIKDNIYKECFAFLGDKGTGELGLIFLKEFWNDKRGIIRVNHKKTNEFKMILGFLGVKTKTIKTSGSLKKAKKFMELKK